MFILELSQFKMLTLEVISQKCRAFSEPAFCVQVSPSSDRYLIFNGASDSSIFNLDQFFQVRNAFSFREFFNLLREQEVHERQNSSNIYIPGMSWPNKQKLDSSSESLSEHSKRFTQAAFAQQSPMS